MSSYLITRFRVDEERFRNGDNWIISTILPATFTGALPLCRIIGCRLSINKLTVIYYEEMKLTNPWLIGVLVSMSLSSVGGGAAPADPDISRAAPHALTAANIDFVDTIFLCKR